MSNIFSDIQDYMIAISHLDENDPFYDYKKADFEHNIECLWHEYHSRMYGQRQQHEQTYFEQYNY